MTGSSSSRNGPPDARSSGADLYIIVEEDAPSPGLQISVTDAYDAKFELREGRFFKIPTPVTSSSPTRTTPVSQERPESSFDTNRKRLWQMNYISGMKLLRAYVTKHKKKFCRSSTAALAAEKLLNYADLTIPLPDAKGAEDKNTKPTATMSAAEYAELDSDQELSEVMLFIKPYLKIMGRPIKPEILSKEYKEPAVRSRPRT